MRELEQRAYSFLGREAVLCMDMVEALRRGLGSVAAVREDGALIYVRASGVYMLAGNIQIEEMLKRVKGKSVQLAVHDRKNAELLREKLNLIGMMECGAAAYLEPFPPRQAALDPRLVRPLGPEQEAEVLGAFPEEFDPFELRERLLGGWLHGAYDGGRLLGTVGIYPEGGVGMLAVSESAPSDTALGLVAYITAWCLENCLAPFAHVPAEDRQARELYERLGYTFSSEAMYWLG